MAGKLPIRLRTLAATVVVVASGAMIMMAYQAIINSTDPNNLTLPVIKASTEPFRVVPDDPGGLTIPNQGSELFKVLDKDNADNLALDGVTLSGDEANETLEENGLSPKGFSLPEIPEDREESLFAIIDEMKQEGDDVRLVSDAETKELEDKLREAIVKTEENIKEAKVVLEAKDVVEEKEVAVEKQAEPEKPVVAYYQIPPHKPTPIANAVERKEVVVEEKAVAPSTASSFDQILDGTQTRHHYIQLASLKDKADAEKSYKTIRDNFPKLVEGLSVFYPQADLGARGVFTRIQIGPLSAEDARKRCADYTTSPNGGTCLVVTR